MQKTLSRLISVFLVTAVIAAIIVPVASAAVQYPEDVTKELVGDAIKKTDKALIYLAEKNGNKDFKEIILPQIYSDKTVSSLMIGFYTMLEEYTDSLSSMGIDVSVQGVKKHLYKYPVIQKKLNSYTQWSEVNLDAAEWNVNSDESFAEAVACVFAPFNNLLHSLLCNGTYTVNSMVSIEGAYGYENAIIPVLEAIGCRKITSSSVFYRDAEKSTNSMIENIVADVLQLLEDILEAPCDKLTEILPEFAYFIKDGGLDNCIEQLVEPLKVRIFDIESIIKIKHVVSFIQNSRKYTEKFSLSLNDITADTDFRIADIDTDALALCGKVTEGKFESDKADAFVWLLGWVVDTVKLNADKLSEEGSGAVNLSGFSSADTDAVVDAILSFMTATRAKQLKYIPEKTEYIPSAVTYTPNLSAEQYQRVADGIDELINVFVAEGGKYESAEEVLCVEIYSNKVVTELAKQIYGVFDSEEMQILEIMTDVDFSPVSVADELKGYKYSSARKTLYGKDSWDSVNYVNWGFNDGNKKDFVKAVCDVFSLCEPLLCMILAEGKITILDSFDIYGSNGYNTAIIPILEALGCSPEFIETYEEFKKSASDGRCVKSIVTAICSLIDRILEKPVYTIAGILPNILYFLDNGGLEAAISNLFHPFTEMLSLLGVTDMYSLTEGFNAGQMISEMADSSDAGIDIANLDLKQFKNMGELVTTESRMTVDGKPVSISVVKADMPAIMVTLLRMIAETIKTPGNENLLMGFSQSDGNGMFASYSENMKQTLENMTVDETVEWLYKLFFRERAVVEEVSREEYIPSIIYEPEQSKNTGFIISVAILAVLAVIVLWLQFWRRTTLKKRLQGV